MILVINIVIVIGTIVLGAKLWRMGGDGQGWARAVAFPALVAAAKLALLGINSPWSWWYVGALLYWPALFGMMSGFSCGESAPPHKVWVWIIGKWTGKYNDPSWRALADGGKIAAVEIATRATCGFFWSIPAAIFAFLTGHWILFGIYVLFLTIANAVIWHYLKDVEKSERAVGACVSAVLLV